MFCVVTDVKLHVYLIRILGRGRAIFGGGGGDGGDSDGDGDGDGDGGREQGCGVDKF